MPRTQKFGHAAKVVAMCLPPVLLSVVGLAVLARTRQNTGAGRAKRTILRAPTPWALHTSDPGAPSASRSQPQRPAG